MKKILQIIAIAVITALAVVSCPAPEVDVTGYDWKTANERNNPDGTTNILSFDVKDRDTAAYAKNPEVTIIFPTESDFLRAGNVEAELKKFLTVHNFTLIPPDPAGTDGKVSPLTGAVDYSLENVAGNAVTIKVNKDYSTITDAYSDLVLKIDSGVYEHSHGLKYDGDGNGVAGEAGYDDVYLTKVLSGSADALSRTNFIPTVNRGAWSISLADFPSLTFTDNATTSENATITAAYIGLNSSVNNTTNGKAIYKAVADLVKDNIKIEKLAGSTWTAEPASAVYDPDTSVDEIRFKDFKATHGATYRFTWTGSANLETAAEYYGVKQRISIRGSSPNTSSAPYYYWNGSSVYNYKALYTLTKVSGGAGTAINGNIVTYITGNFKGTAISYDANDRNAIVRLDFGFKGANPSVGLDEALISNLTNFKNSFKIYYSPSYISSISALYTSANVIEIPITKVEGVKEQLPGGTATQTAVSALVITLDPARAISPTYISGGYKDGDWIPDDYVPKWCEAGEWYDEVWLDDTYIYELATLTDGDGNYSGPDGQYYLQYDDGIDGYFYDPVWVTADNFEEFEEGTDFYKQTPDQPAHAEYNYTIPTSGMYKILVPGHVEQIPLPGHTSIGNYFYILISPDFGYTGGKYLFGSLSNYEYDGFALYGIQ